jgi:hypothetical protein
MTIVLCRNSLLSAVHGAKQSCGCACVYVAVRTRALPTVPSLIVVYGGNHVLLPWVHMCGTSDLEAGVSDHQKSLEPQDEVGDGAGERRRTSTRATLVR